MAAAAFAKQFNAGGDADNLRELYKMATGTGKDRPKVPLLGGVSSATPRRPSDRPPGSTPRGPASARYSSRKVDPPPRQATSARLPGPVSLPSFTPQQPQKAKQFLVSPRQQPPAPDVTAAVPAGDAQPPRQESTPRQPPSARPQTTPRGAKTDDKSGGEGRKTADVTPDATPTGDLAGVHVANLGTPALVEIPKPGTVFEYDGGSSVVLPRQMYTQSPSEEEVVDYANWLGVNTETEKELLWIAKEGLTAPLPQTMRPCKTQGGDVFYFDFGTGDSSWDHPLDEFYKDLVSNERERLVKAKEAGTTYEATEEHLQKVLQAGMNALEQKKRDTQTPLSVAVPAGTIFKYDDGGYSVVLDDDAPAREASQKEVDDYAEWLGLNKETEGDLVWIAKEALRIALPSQWKPCKTNNGDLYYFNFRTGESLWDHPMDSLFQGLVPEEREKLQKSKDGGPPYDPTPGYVKDTVARLVAVRTEAAGEGEVVVGSGGELVRIPDSGSVFMHEDGGYSAVLEDNVEGYEPASQEVIDYADWLGLDRETDKDLYWIAKEALRAALPEHWRPCKTDSGDVYYFNFNTGDSQWDHPMDEYYKELVPKERERLKQAKAGGA